MKGSATGGLNVTTLVAFRCPPTYSQLIDRLAAELGISIAALLRRGVEHYASTVAADQIGSDIPDQLISAGQQIRSKPHRSLRAAATPTLAGEG